METRFSAPLFLVIKRLLATSTQNAWHFDSPPEIAIIYTTVNNVDEQDIKTFARNILYG